MIFGIKPLDPIMMELRKLIKASGLTQIQLAKKLDSHQNMISDVVNKREARMHPDWMIKAIEILKHG